MYVDAITTLPILLHVIAINWVALMVVPAINRVFPRLRLICNAITWRTFLLIKPCSIDCATYCGTYCVIYVLIYVMAKTNSEKRWIYVMHGVLMSIGCVYLGRNFTEDNFPEFSLVFTLASYHTKNHEDLSP